MVAGAQARRAGGSLPCLEMPFSCWIVGGSGDPEGGTWGLAVLGGLRQFVSNTRPATPLCREEAAQEM